MLIELYEVGNLRVVKWNHRVAPHHPGRLATSKSSPEVLLYMDEKSSTRDVRYLDCSTFPPKASNKTISVAGRLQDYFLYDLCSISQGNDQLILSSFGYKGIYAFNASTRNTKWKIFEKLSGMDTCMRARGIATDEEGHLFVCDADNQCVQRRTESGDTKQDLLAPQDVVFRCCSSGKERTLLYRCFHPRMKPFRENHILVYIITVLLY